MPVGAEHITPVESQAVREFANVPVVPPTDQQFDRVAQRQQQVMGGTYDRVFSEQNMTEGRRRYLNKLRAAFARIEKMNWEPASIINLMPWPLNINGVLHSRLQGPDGHQVPAFVVGKEPSYVQRIIRQPVIDIRDEGADFNNVDNLSPELYLPLEMAQEYLDQFGKIWGGVLVYEGTHAPDSTPGLRHKLEEAMKERNRYLLQKVREADVEWADPRRRNNVTEIHRRSAEVLLHDKIIKKQPEWLIVANESGKAPETCIGCGATYEKKALVCAGCGYVFSPLAAYEAALIEFGHVSMSKMTADEWKRAGEIEAQRQANRAAGTVAQPEPKSDKPKK